MAPDQVHGTVHLSLSLPRMVTCHMNKTKPSHISAARFVKGSRCRNGVEAVLLDQCHSLWYLASYACPEIPMWYHRHVFFFFSLCRNPLACAGAHCAATDSADLDSQSRRRSKQKKEERLRSVLLPPSTTSQSRTFPDRWPDHCPQACDRCWLCPCCSS